MARRADSAGAPSLVELNGRYQGDTPRGNVQLRSSTWRFKGDDFRAALVAVGDQAILELDGLGQGAPATLRLRLLDAGELGRDDTFRAWLGPDASGLVGAQQGNLTGGSK